ncbi:MAG: hypothetical protein H8K03_19165 [Nitrospira sp.]|jgi:thiol:disulfide interchange protein|nr:hypothetical protein [Nitrospira sp. BO4]
MNLRWFNVLGFVMLFLALFLNEIVFLNVWHGSNFSLVAVAVAYYVVAIGLSLWGGSHRPQRG